MEDAPMPSALVTHVLAAWREAERLAAEAPPGSPEQLMAADAARQLHEIYAEVVAAAGEDDDPVSDTPGVVQPLRS